MNFKRNEGWLTVGHISLMQMEILEKDLKLRSFHRHLIWKISCRTAFNPKTFSPILVPVNHELQMQRGFPSWQ